ncbi:MAG: type II toxin-antitoxin system RelE/ParE family toxin [Acidobacteriota bacterium]
MKAYRFTSSALTELKQATLHYEGKENGLGGIFLDEVDTTVARILANPNAWHPLSPRTRRCRTHRFPFGLIYQVRSDEILITSVMDLRRDPISWKHLL